MLVHWHSDITYICLYISLTCGRGCPQATVFNYKDIHDDFSSLWHSKSDCLKDFYISWTLINITWFSKYFHACYNHIWNHHLYFFNQSRIKTFILMMGLCTCYDLTSVPTLLLFPKCPYYFSVVFLLNIYIFFFKSYISLLYTLLLKRSMCHHFISFFFHCLRKNVYYNIVYFLWFTHINKSHFTLCPQWTFMRLNCFLSGRFLPFSY